MIGVFKNLGEKNKQGEKKEKKGGKKRIPFCVANLVKYFQRFIHSIH